MWKTILDWLLTLLKAWLKIPSVTSIFIKLYNWIFEYFSKIRRDQIDKDRKGMEQALDDLKKAETAEEIDAAAEKIGKHI